MASNLQLTLKTEYSAYTNIKHNITLLLLTLLLKLQIPNMNPNRTD